MHVHAPGVRACMCAYHDEGVHAHRHPRARLVPGTYLKIQQLLVGPHLVQDARAPSLARWLLGITADAKLCAYALSEPYCSQLHRTNPALSLARAGTGCHSRSLPALCTHASVTHANHRLVRDGKKIRRTCSLRLPFRLCLPGTSPKQPPAHRGRRHASRRQSVDGTAQSRRGGTPPCLTADCALLLR
jgi:hypothetical protein